MNLNNIVRLFCIGLFGCTVFGQQPTVETGSILSQELEEVVVTATRTVRQLSSVPLPVTLVSKQQLQKTGVIRLDEILNEQTGIITVADQSGFNGIQIQGVAADYVMILIDGVPLVGRSAGNFDLSRLAVGNIKQVEIIKGPSSSLYGSEALGGVVNIITETPKDKQLRGDVSYRFASFNTHDANMNLKQKRGKLGYSFFANALYSDGYDLRPEVDGQTVAPFHNYTINGQINYDFSNKLSLFASGRYYTQEQEVAFAVNDALIEGEGVINEGNVHLRMDSKMGANWQLQYEFYYTNYKATEELVNTATNSSFSESDYDQKLLRPELRVTYNIKDNNAITFGLGYNRENLDRTFFDDAVSFDSQYLYAQYDFYPFQKVNVILGARFDNHSEYQSQLSPKGSVNYALSENLSLKGSVGYGFKAPDFRQLYFDFTNSAVGYTVLGYNVAPEKIRELEAQGQLTDILFDLADLEEPLEAESSVGYNLGAAYTLGNVKLHLNYFRNDFQNLIDTRAIARKANGQNVFSYTNFARIYTTGIELDARYRLNENVLVSGGYQLLYAKDKDKKVALERGEIFARDPQTLQTVVLDNSDYFGLVNRSRHTANLKLFYEVPKWDFNANLRINYRSKYGLFDGNGNDIIDTYDTTFVDGFALANLALNKTFASNYVVQVGANNLFNYRDEENIPGLAGIQLYTKISIQF